MDNQGIAAAQTVFWRRKLPQILTLAAISIAVLIPFLPKETPICTTSTCLQEANRITHQVSSENSACDVFYKFVCGNSQRNVDPVTSLKRQARNQLMNLYLEPFMAEEYPIVTSTKKLFRACLNETSPRLSEFNIKEIKKALKLAGGWPLLEGSNWNEKKFDWLDATYKLRDLGYDYDIFLNLSVIENPRNRSKYIFQVSLPALDALTPVQLTNMLKIAILLGSNVALSDIDETYKYILKLFYGARNLPWYNEYVLSSIKTYQKEQGSDINWVQFINKIISPVFSISNNDSVIFPHAEQLTAWLNMLSNVPKRIQANYVMWMAIERIVANIQFDEQYGNFRANGCFEKMKSVFRNVPNPIDVLYVQKYLPRDKLKMVEDLANNIKFSFLDFIENSKWLDNTDKKAMMKIMKQISKNMLIGAPKIYFQDNILEEMSADLEEVDNTDYLKILLQLNKHRYNLLFTEVNSPINERKLISWNLIKATEDSLYYYMENVIALPATLLQGTFFNENRPNYLNYGSFGTFLAAEYAHHLLTALLAKDMQWSNKTQKGFLKIRRCFLQQLMDNLKINGVMSEWDFEMFYQTVSTNISYSAYQKWEKSNGIEPKLGSTNYTNYQLFWISSASFYCQNLYALPKVFNIHKNYAYYVDGIGFNNEFFAKDFNCPLESKMNHLEKCYV